MHRAVIATGEIATLRALNLDYPCAEVGELAGRVRRRDRLLKAHDGDIGQWRIGQFRPTPRSDDSDVRLKLTAGADRRDQPDAATAIPVIHSGTGSDTSGVPRRAPPAAP